MPNSENVSHTRYNSIQEIGRGGMGEVWLARDRQLQRDLALKVLSASRVNDPAFVDRFIEEAQIAAQLQHPGIVPVHDIGKLEDQRPFFTMRLVKGETLEELLLRRRSLDESQDHWLGVFHQVCQAMAYTHSKGVIHRDLKPTNIMVGRFGEVQVMDWGLAKILKQSNLTDRLSPRTAADLESKSTASEAATELPSSQQSSPSQSVQQDSTVDDDNTVEMIRAQSVIQSIRYSPEEEPFAGSESLPGAWTDPGSLTSQGYILGTIAFMPPEQAQGRYEELSCSSDVFALGAILCVILTGEPPYRSTSKADRLAMAATGDLKECLGRLESSPYDRSLVELAIDCLAINPLDRPQDASQVANRISQHLANVRDRLRQAELDRATADAKLESAIQTQRLEQQRRKWARAATTAIAACIVLGSLSFAWIRQQQATVQLTSLQREQERTRRLDQSRQSFEQSAIPVQLILDRLERSEQVPSQSDLTELDTAMDQARNAYGQADPEVQKSLDFQRLIEHCEQTKNLVQLFQNLPDKIDPTWLRQSSVSLPALRTKDSSSAMNSADVTPLWAEREWAAAVALSAYRFRSLPFEIAEQWNRSEYEHKCWSAVEKQDWVDLSRLLEDPQIDEQSLAFQRNMASILIEESPIHSTRQAINSCEWVLCQPIKATGTRSSARGLRKSDEAFEVSKDGWIEVPNDRNDQYKIVIPLPAEAVNLFRIETYCGPRVGYQPQLQVTESVNVPTAPTTQLSNVDSAIHGPGLLGFNLGSCLIRKIRLSRVADDGELVEMKVERVLSEHVTALGQEADCAFDDDNRTCWSLIHPNNVMYASTLLEIEPLTANQIQGEMVWEIGSGLDTLWQSTLLGRFRIYYAKQVRLPGEELLSSAEQLLEKLGRRFPADIRIFGLQARARIASSVLAKRNRETATVLAATAASIAPYDVSGLRLFTEMTLAMQPAIDDPWYRRLIDHVDSLSDSSAVSQAKQKIASYQRERCDRMFALLPSDAYDAYREAQRLDPIAFHRHGRLAWELLRQSLPDDALAIATKGISGTKCESEDLYYYGLVAARVTGSAASALKAFEQWMQVEPLRSETRLQLLHTRLAFLAGETARGITLLNEHQTKIGENPAVVTAAAIDFVRGGKRDELQRLVELWQSVDTEAVRSSKDFSIARDRRRAWGVIAMAAVELGCQECLTKTLAVQCEQVPALLDEILIQPDQLLLARVPPPASFVNLANSQKLVELLRALQPDEPRWKIRAALLQGLDGNWPSAAALLQELPFEHSGNGDAIMNVSTKRNWQAFARVVVAVSRFRQSLFNNEQMEAEVEAAQKVLGRVPLGDRDLVEWLWWEFRLKDE